MIETAHLTIADRQPKDALMEEYYHVLHPELKDLDPVVGEAKDPVFYSIFTKEDNRHIGMCCLYNFTDTEVELGIRIFIPEYWNKGYGGEVIGALCEYVFNSAPQITAVLAKTPMNNARAIKCYERCQFRQYLRAFIGGYDMVLMERLREISL